ncbi:MAG TPA: hypothetical protein VFZ65_19025 [Planctomycetota bacterium]|nr:hypothetical protein [Planctomycetota bacterium]
MTRLLSLGSDHLLGPLAQLGVLRAAHDEVLARLVRLRALGRCHGAVAIDTCNRFEVLLDLGDASLQEVRDAVFGGLPQVPLRDHADEAVVLHVLRTATGLESLVRGEDQISGQMTRAFQEARDLDLLSTTLQKLWSRCAHVARQLRGRRPADPASKSVAELAARIARESGPRVAVVGAGATGRVALETLHKLGTPQLWLYNRTVPKAEALAAHFGATAGSLDDLLSTPPNVDAVVLAIEGRELLLPVRQMPSLRAVIDVSQPSVLAPAMREHGGVRVHDLDALAARAQAESARSADWQRLVGELAVGHSRRIWGELHHDTCEQRQLGHLVDLHLAVAREETEKSLRNGLGDLSTAQRAAVLALVERVAKRNAHMHVKDLCQAVRS